MDVRNLVLEIAESESAAGVQARLDEAAKDGFFMVNVVGRLVLLRTVTQPKPVKAEIQSPGPQVNKDGNEDAALAFIKAHDALSIRALVKGLSGLGITRKKTWVSDARFTIRDGR